MQIYIKKSTQHAKVKIFFINALYSKHKQYISYPPNEPCLVLLHGINLEHLSEHLDTQQSYPQWASYMRFCWQVY